MIAALTEKYLSYLIIVFNSVRIYFADLIDRRVLAAEKKSNSFKFFKHFNRKPMTKLRVIPKSYYKI